MVETLHNSTYISSYRSLRIAFPIIYILKDTFQFRIHKLTLVSLFPLSKIEKVKYLTQKCDINMYFIVVLLKNWSECHRISCEDTILDSLDSLHSVRIILHRLKNLISICLRYEIEYSFYVQVGIQKAAVVDLTNFFFIIGQKDYPKGFLKSLWTVNFCVHSHVPEQDSAFLPTEEK